MGENIIAPNVSSGSLKFRAASPVKGANENIVYDEVADAPSVEEKQQGSSMLNDLDDLDIGDLDSIVKMQAAKGRGSSSGVDASSAPKTKPISSLANNKDGTGIGMGSLLNKSSSANTEFSVSKMVKHKNNKHFIA